MFFQFTPKSSDSHSSYWERKQQRISQYVSATVTWGRTEFYKPVHWLTSHAYKCTVCKRTKQWRLLDLHWCNTCMQRHYLSFQLDRNSPLWILTGSFSHKIQVFSIHYLRRCWGQPAHWNSQGCTWSASRGWKASSGRWSSFQSPQRQKCGSWGLQTLQLSESPKSQSSTGS